MKRFYPKGMILCLLGFLCMAPGCNPVISNVSPPWASEGAEVVIVEEIERLPLAGLQFANIEVFQGFGRKASTALYDYRNGVLQPLYYGSSPFSLSGPAAMHP